MTQPSSAADRLCPEFRGHVPSLLVPKGCGAVVVPGPTGVEVRAVREEACCPARHEGTNARWAGTLHPFRGSHLTF